VLKSAWFAKLFSSLSTDYKNDVFLRRNGFVLVYLFRSKSPYNPMLAIVAKSNSTMIRFTFTFFFLFSGIALLTAQDLSQCQVVIGATGGAATESGRRYAYTVGETVIFTLQKPGINIELTQGFHQPDVCLPVSTDQPELWADWDVQVYPNPAMEVLHLQFSAAESPILYLTVTSMKGEVLIAEQVINTAGEVLPCAHWQAGQYVIQLRHPRHPALISIPFIKL
jgi:hypothetical protein